MFAVMIAPLAGGGVARAADGSHELEVRARAVYWNDESTAVPTTAAPNPRANRYEQSAVGIQLNYRSPHWADIVGFDASVYGVGRVADSGVPTTNLVEVRNDGQLDDGYATLGQAFVKLKYGDLFQARAGRQLQDSLLLNSTSTRAVPDTYSGISTRVKQFSGLVLYGAAYDKWRSRSTGHFDDFRTESTAAGVPRAIDYVALAGARYARGPFAITAEFLHSKDYLSKFGIVGAWTTPVKGNPLKLSAGLFTSRDAGSLFVCGAERELDCTGTGRIDNDGLGAYVDVDWKIGNLTLGAAVAKFDGFWIEDNFAVDAERAGSLTQDHGTNPFPTSAALGPDLTNNGETVYALRAAYDWKDYVAGLRTAVKYARGSGARSSNLVNDARGNERYREIDVRYALPFVKNLSLRYVYLNYDSHIANRSGTATIRGIPRAEWEQHRFYVDWVHRF